MFDNDPRRCRGVCRYSVRCKRYGTPVDTGDGYVEYWCPKDHEHQRTNGLGQEFRRLDAEYGREWFGAYENLD